MSSAEERCVNLWNENVVHRAARRELEAEKAQAIEHSLSLQQQVYELERKVFDLEEHVDLLEEDYRELVSENRDWRIWCRAMQAELTELKL